MLLPLVLAASALAQDGTYDTSTMRVNAFQDTAVITASAILLAQVKPGEGVPEGTSKATKGWAPTPKAQERAGHLSDTLAPLGIGKVAKAPYKAFGAAAMVGGAFALGTYSDRRAGDAGLANSVVLLESVVLAGGITSVLKTAIHRPRPYTSTTYVTDFESHEDYEDHTKEKKRTGEVVTNYDSWASMPSGHTSTSAAGYFALSTMWVLYALEGGDDTAIALAYASYAPATLLAGGVGHLRVRAAKHHVGDVLAGGLLGAATGVAVPVVHHLLLPSDADAGADGVLAQRSARPLPKLSLPLGIVDLGFPTVVGVGPGGLVASGRW